MAKPKTDETKAERSVRLANMRINNTLKKISLVSNLAAANYTFTEEQVEKINETLSDAVVNCMNKFNKIQTTTEQFSL